MRRILWFFAGFTALVGGIASAQQVPAAAEEAKLINCPKWDAAVSVGLLSTNPGPSDDPYAGEWYFTGRYAASIGRYWTRHLKTEVEVVTTNDGERYVQRYANQPGVPPTYSYTTREHHTLRQVSGRTVWQFFDNAWVHPYVFGGIVYDADRVETFVPPQYYYPDPRTPSSPLVLAPAVNTSPTTMHRFGVTGGVGSKIYLSPNAFFNTAIVVSYAKPATTASVIGGFGVDF